MKKVVSITKEMTAEEFQSKLEKYFSLCEKDPAVMKAQEILEYNCRGKSPSSDAKAIKKAMKKCLELYDEVGLDISDGCKCGDCKCSKPKSKKRSK